MHRCAASCCDDKTFSAQRVQNCVENCSGPLEKAQHYMQGEFERVQVIYIQVILFLNIIIWVTYC